MTLGDDDDGLPTRGQTMASTDAMDSARARAVAAKATKATSGERRFAVHLSGNSPQTRPNPKKRKEKKKEEEGP